MLEKIVFTGTVEEVNNQGNVTQFDVMDGFRMHMGDALESVNGETVRVTIEVIANA